MLAARSTPVHARLPGILAELHSGWEIWLQFALEVGAINPAEKDQLESAAHSLSRPWRRLHAALSSGE